MVVLSGILLSPFPLEAVPEPEKVILNGMCAVVNCSRTFVCHQQPCVCQSLELTFLAAVSHPFAPTPPRGRAGGLTIVAALLTSKSSQ